MSSIATMSVEEQTRHVCGLLKEYAAKLVDLKGREREFTHRIDTDSLVNEDRFAWWLDECERIRKPLLAVVSFASQTLEHLDPEPLARDELTLRLAEIEVHLHHTLRRYFYWRDRVSKDKNLKAQIDPLRMMAGLPGE